MTRVPCVALAVLAASLVVTSKAAADPPTPSGAHPRLFMSATELAAYETNAATKGTAAAGLVAQCQETIASPKDYSTRGGSDGNYWPQSAVACAFAYVTTQNAQYLTQALLYWKASLSDDQTIGDGLGCVAGVSTNWQTWAMAGKGGAAPPVILTVTHDTGYPIRWYGPDIALTYDWLYSAPGASALVTQTQVCLPNWLDYYTGYGYHNTEAGANYNAGYVVAKALGAIALGTDGGADGHLWTQVLDDDFTKTLIGAGLAGTSTVGTPAGVMLGGDWGEGWEYGPLSVVEYAASAAALESSGASLPPMDTWAGSLVLRDLYATTPPGTFVYCGNGDCDITTPNNTPNPNELDAVLLGPSSDQAAAWALSAKQTGSVSATGDGAFIYNALAEARAVTAQDYTKQTPAPPLWYLARGTREVYARTAWDDPGAYWGVFISSPQLNSDHQHFTASSFVFSRGADDLIVDPSPYGGPSSWQANAVTADSAVVMGDYAPSQTPWSLADLPWARGTSDATVAARSDFAQAFIFSSTPSDITYAHREWTMLPEGEVVVIDRVHTSAASRSMYVTLHTNTGGGGLAASNGIYLGKAGSSQVAIHPVYLSGGTPAVTQPTTGDCTASCSYPCAQCNNVRFAVDEYQVKVPGTWAVAVHVIDGLGASEAPATVDSMNDGTVDPGKQNTGVLGAAVLRTSKQTYVVASSAVDGVSPATMTYGVPGAGDARHIVFDAPEAADGTSTVTAAAMAGRCVVSITPGGGGGFTGHPLMFSVAAASGGCMVTDSTSVSPSPPPSGDGGVEGGASSSGGGGDGGGSGSGGGVDAGHAGDGGADGGAGASGSPGKSSGCGCTLAGAEGTETGALLLLGLGCVVIHVRRRRTLRDPPRSRRSLG
ncbi:MAG TPA: hypothetical protein VGL81_25905 [Polyangiaceae bacterium]|jgi:hypothetical protein